MCVRAMRMTEAAKLMMMLGGLLLAIGAVLWLLGRVGFRGLPGDFRYEGESFRIYVPIVTCIVLSVVLTLGVWLWRWLSGR